jgi:hypothetical protein
LVGIPGCKCNANQTGGTIHQAEARGHSSPLAGCLGLFSSHGSGSREKTVMSQKDTTTSQIQNAERPPHRVRLPGFIIEEEIGLGDAIKKVTYAMGIKTCGGCESRATKLNRRMVFSR